MNIDFKYLITLFINKRHYILISMLFCFSISMFLGTYFIKPEYSASTSVLINNSKINDNSYNKIETNLQLLNTYKVIATQPGTLDRLAKKINKTNDNALTSSQLLKMIIVKSSINSQIITITVKSKNPHKSILIANTIVSILKERASDLMKATNSIITVSEAELEKKESNPNKLLMSFSGLVFGLLSSCIFIIIKDRHNQTIKSYDFFKSNPNIYFLGSLQSSDIRHSIR